ncbi:putative RNA polymerase II subunit B1 CTD phosphatase RPAP2 [Nymphalis io]|uniref:putative RNA polymerase II subunit B1 CTD phosphatase RPAP2 n=1 Tax=Inachis io TaxID=171585 RepID=UPI002168DB14|nr:putative RNA polymerase II subunit B1 CTD phosphatase RPAP2 [Nymphalis io]
METLEKRPLKKPTKIEEMTKEQIRQAIIKKRQCNAKAQSIVESLLEKCVDEDFFLNSLSDINQSHFDDVIEERSILHLCGYPLCQRTLSEKDIPKQKYRILVKTNKVYDITARKSFCSNICYKSAMHVKKQMLTSPLWFRDYEEIPKFCLLPLNATGSLGQEIDLSLTEKINLKSEPQTFTSINDFSNATLHEINAFQNKNNNNKNVQENPNETDVLKTDSDITKLNQKVHKLNLSNEFNEGNSRIKEDDKLNINKNNIATGSNSTKNNASNPLNIVGEIIEKPEKKIDPILLNSPANTSSAPPKNLNMSMQKLTQQKKQPSINIIMIEVEKCLAEWFTLDTLIYLFGEDKLKQLVADKGQCIKDYLNNYSKSIFYNSNSYDQYQILCRKLNMLELEDRRYDAQTLSRETKPLPDYSILKEESKKMQLKVKAFFAGETVIPEVGNEESDLTNVDENTTQLPLVDKNAQNALRRRIVCHHLNKVLPDLLKSLGLLTLTISSDIRLLVNTFKLKANNIMFKPIQWTLIAIVFIRLLSIRDKRLEYLLEQPTAFRHMQLLLLSYKQDGGYLDRLISWLTDIDRLLDVNDTQLTIE